MSLYDISQSLSDRIAVWPGDQKFRHRWSMRIQDGDSCNVSAVTMSVHTGTHLDAPFHFDDRGTDAGGLAIEACLGPARVVSIPAELDSISSSLLETLDWSGVERVLFRTASSGLAEHSFRRDFVFLAEDGAEFLAARRLRLVGTDAPSVDAFDSKTLRSHKILHAGGVAILEGARLAHVPPGEYELICLPLKFVGLDGSPVRAILRSRRSVDDVP